MTSLKEKKKKKRKNPRVNSLSENEI